MDLLNKIRCVLLLRLLRLTHFVGPSEGTAGHRHNLGLSICLEEQEASVNICGMWKPDKVF